MSLQHPAALPPQGRASRPGRALIALLALLAGAAAVWGLAAMPAAAVPARAVLTDTPTAAPTLGATAVPTATPTAVATLASSPTPTPCTIAFSDVQPDDYFYLGVQYLACRGVVSGYADGRFQPYHYTTRSQQVKMVALSFQLAPYLPPDGGYTFADVPPAFPFFSYIETAVHAGIISGYACGGPGEPCDPQNRPYYRPYLNTTRAQFAKILVNAAGWALVAPASPTFADVPADSPFYLYVETAACRGILSGYACGGPGEPCDRLRRPYFRPQESITRGQFAKLTYLALTQPGACALPTVTPGP